MGVEDVGSVTCSLFQPVHLDVCKVNGKITGYLINIPLLHVYCASLTFHSQQRKGQ